jgi:hypothetical protein
MIRSKSLAASSRAVARPIPADAPVTIAIFLIKKNIILGSPTNVKNYLGMIYSLYLQQRIKR